MLGLSLRADRRRLAIGGALVLLAYATTPLIALGLKLLTNAALQDQTGRAIAFGLVVAGLLIGEVMLGHFAHMAYFEAGELAELGLNEEIVELANGSVGLEHHERPDYADRLELLRKESGRTRAVLEAALQLAGLALQMAITAVLLAELDPLLLLLPLAAVPPLVLGKRAQGLLERAKERMAGQSRLSRHLLRLATTASSATEARLFGLECELVARQRAVWDTITRAEWAATWRGALLRAGGQLVFAASYGAAVFVVVRGAISGHASVGDVVLVITLAAQVNVQVANGITLLHTLHGAAATVDRLRWLRATARPVSDASTAARHIPPRLERGIVLEHVGFRYPGAETAVLEDVSLELPPRSTVALVGENGAGKTTLVKLLCRFYEPTEGRILLDGADVRDLPVTAWRARVATLFQDFGRIELLLRESVGLGELALVEDREAVSRALRRAQADDVARLVPGGLEGLLGRSYGPGRELSGGQWQKLGLARSFMREHPLLLILDEPASALDAAAEDELFRRYSASARAAGDLAGAITLFVSHRFSTVRLADVIVVLEGGRIAEHGTHADLVALGGRYAELFELHASAYR